MWSHCSAACNGCCADLATTTRAGRKLVERADFPDAEAVKNLHQNALGRRDALQQPVCLSRLRIGRAGLDGPAQIVNDLQQLAGKIRDRVLLGVFRAPFALAPGILRLGQRPHQAVAQRGNFGCQIGFFTFVFALAGN